MSVCPSTTQSNTETDALNVSSPESTQEEASSTTLSSEISSANNQQLAILRSMSDSCLSLLNQSGSVFAQHMAKNMPKPSEVLTAKTGMMVKSSSLPTLKTHESSHLSFSQNNNSAKQTQTLPTTSTETKQQSLLPALTLPSHSAKTASPGKTTTLTVYVTQSSESGSSSTPMTFSQASITVSTYSKETIKAQSTREKPHLSSSKETSKPSTTQQKSSSSSLSPLALFSNLQKETPAPRLESKPQDKEKEEGKHSHQEHQEHQEHKHHQQHKNNMVIDELSCSGSISYTHSPMLPDEIIDFALSEAQLSSLMQMRVTNLDVLRICAEIMKLMLNSREQDSLARLEARKHLIEKAKDLVESYESQAKLTQWLGVATATLGILGATSPLVGEVAGDKILDFLQKNVGLFKNATSKTFFSSAGKICSSLSQLTESSSKIYELKETASRTFSENYKEIFRIEHDEITRSIEEVKDHWKNMDNFLLQILQAEHDAVRSLYQ